MQLILFPQLLGNAIIFIIKSGPAHFGTFDTFDTSDISTLFIIKSGPAHFANFGAFDTFGTFDTFHYSDLVRLVLLIHSGHSSTSLIKLDH